MKVIEAIKIVLYALLMFVLDVLLGFGVLLIMVVIATVMIPFLSAYYLYHHVDNKLKGIK